MIGLDSEPEVKINNLQEAMLLLQNGDFHSGAINFILKNCPDTSDIFYKSGDAFSISALKYAEHTPNNEKYTPFQAVLLARTVDTLKNLRQVEAPLDQEVILDLSDCIFYLEASGIDSPIRMELGSLAYNEAKRLLDHIDPSVIDDTEIAYIERLIRIANDSRIDANHEALHKALILAVGREKIAKSMNEGVNSEA